MLSAIVGGGVVSRGQQLPTPEAASLLLAQELCIGLRSRRVTRMSVQGRPPQPQAVPAAHRLGQRSRQLSVSEAASLLLSQELQSRRVTRTSIQSKPPEAAAALPVRTHTLKSSGRTVRKLNYRKVANCGLVVSPDVGATKRNIRPRSKESTAGGNDEGRLESHVEHEENASVKLSREIGLAQRKRAGTVGKSHSVVRRSKARSVMKPGSDQDSGDADPETWPTTLTNIKQKVELPEDHILSGEEPTAFPASLCGGDGLSCGTGPFIVGYEGTEHSTVMDQCGRQIPAATVHPCETKCSFLLYKSVEQSVSSDRLFSALANEMCTENGASGEVSEGNMGAKIPKNEAKLPATVPKRTDDEKTVECGSPGKGLGEKEFAVAPLHTAATERFAEIGLIREVPLEDAVSGDVPDHIPSATSATLAGNRLPTESLARDKTTAESVTFEFLSEHKLTDAPTDTTSNQLSTADTPKAVPLGVVTTINAIPKNEVPPGTTMETSVECDLPNEYSMERAMASIMLKVNELFDVPTSDIAIDDSGEDELSTVDGLSTEDELSMVDELSTEDELSSDEELTTEVPIEDVAFDKILTENELADIPADTTAAAMEICTAVELAMEVGVTTCSPRPAEQLASEALTEPETAESVTCEILVDEELVDIPTDIVLIEFTVENDEAKSLEVATTKGTIAENGLFVIFPDIVDGAANTVLSHGEFSENEVVVFSPDPLASIKGVTSKIPEANGSMKPAPDVANMGMAAEGEVRAALTNDNVEGGITAALTNAFAEGEVTAVLTNDNAEGEVRAALTNADAEGEVTAALTSTDAEGEVTATLTNDNAEGEVTAALTNAYAEGEVTVPLTNANAEGEITVALPNANAEGEVTPALTNADAEGEVTAALANDAEGEVTAALTNAYAEGEVTAALTNADAKGEVTATLTNGDTEDEVTLARNTIFEDIKVKCKISNEISGVSTFQKKLFDPLTLKEGNVCTYIDNEEMCCKDNGCQDVDLDNRELESLSVQFTQTACVPYKVQEAICVEKKGYQTVMDRTDVPGEFGISPVREEAPSYCGKLKGLQVARRRKEFVGLKMRKLNHAMLLSNCAPYFPRLEKFWANKTPRCVDCCSIERNCVTSDMDHKVQPVEELKPKKLSLVQINNLAHSKWHRKPMLLEHLSTIANGLSVFSKCVQMPQESPRTSDLIIAMGLCSRFQLLQFCFNTEQTSCINTFCHLSSTSKEQPISVKPPAQFYSKDQYWPFPSDCIRFITPDFPITPHLNVTSLLSFLIDGGEPVKQCSERTDLSITPKHSHQDSWAVSQCQVNFGKTNWLPASPFKAGRCPCTRSRFGLHTVLALSSPACYRVWTRQRHFGRVPNSHRPFLTQFGEGLKRLILPVHSDKLFWSLSYTLGRVVSWWNQHSPSPSESRFNISPSDNCRRSSSSFHPSNLITGNGTNLSEAKSLLILQVNKRIDLQHLNFDCLKEPYLALPELPTSSPECTITDSTFSSASALAPSITYVETQLHAEQKEECTPLDKPVRKSKGSLRKVSQIRIRKSVPKQDTNLTPMGLPKPKRLKKKEFSLEEIYTNQNYKSPSAHSKYMETIFEEPILKKGSFICTSLQKRKRLLEFQDYTLPRKRRAHTGVRVQSRTRARKATTREGEIDSLLVQKLTELEAFLAGED
ncbi:uncharacterized protein wu:fi75a02 isoform X2 [Scyliorhinus canicula]|uniref:uncharacterized protein wu:fi75a02 isoform X2 n=1 Tax=Scyliorhinus canicula TaxID=7830 RepID=UPI0018F33576|nr:uncharacterized protein wu:fi75a02 isoform X2 [Scyliorhinus canicula]